MEFEIAFNRSDIGTDEQLELLGAEKIINDEYGDMGYSIEISDLNHLDNLITRINKEFDFKYFVIIDSDHPTLFLDLMDNLNDN